MSMWAKIELKGEGEQERNIHISSYLFKRLKVYWLRNTQDLALVVLPD